jgi:hypothetical protein
VAQKRWALPDIYEQNAINIMVMMQRRLSSSRVRVGSALPVAKSPSSDTKTNGGIGIKHCEKDKGQPEAENDCESFIQARGV